MISNLFLRFCNYVCVSFVHYFLCFFGALGWFLLLFGHGDGCRLRQKRFLVRPERHLCGSHMMSRPPVARSCEPQPHPKQVALMWTNLEV